MLNKTEEAFLHALEELEKSLAHADHEFYFAIRAKDLSTVVLNLSKSLCLFQKANIRSWPGKPIE